MSDHGANAFFAGKSAELGAANAIPPLNDVDALELSEILDIDAKKYYQAGLITYMDAIGGITSKTWSWCAVKLYYSVFYLIRSLLALEGIAFVSVGKRVYWIKAEPGAELKRFPEKKHISSDTAIPKKNLSGSHGSVLYLLEANFPTSKLLSQEIDGYYPTEWMMKQREKHNYLNCGFPDPAPSDSFLSFSNVEFHTLMKAYYYDEDFLYTFSPEHAIVAYPTFVIKHVANRFHTHIDYDEDSPPKKEFISNLLRAQDGNLQFLEELII
jgi:uncharacterized protein (UPF0332 family)